MGPLIPLLWTSGDIFKSQRRQPYLPSQRHISYIFLEIHLWCNTCQPPERQPSCSFPCTCKQVLVGLNTVTYHAPLARSVRPDRRSADWAMLLFKLFYFWLNLPLATISPCNQFIRSFLKYAKFSRKSFLSWRHWICIGTSWPLLSVCWPQAGNNMCPWWRHATIRSHQKWPVGGYICAAINGKLSWSLWQFRK